MRFISALVLFFPLTAFAADNAKPHVAAVEKPGISAWQSLNKSGRRDVLNAWKALPETTRPSFPIFRDSQLKKRLKPASPAIKIK